MLTGERALTAAGLDGVALKPAESDVRRGLDLPLEAVFVDYEGNQHHPDPETLRAVAAEKEAWVTVPLRADGFDPLGDDRLLERLPDEVNRVLVAGNGAYLSEEERSRPVSPRLRAARERAPEAWVGTEGIERIALAAGGTQFELLSRTTERDLRSLRAAGFEGELAVYAPTVLTDDEDAVLDALGAYAARRRPVSRALPDSPVTDAGAEGRNREVLLRGIGEYALIGTPAEVRDRVDRLREAGADVVVGYPARGIDGVTR